MEVASLSFLFLSIHLALADEPNIINRETWGARAPKSTTFQKFNPIPFVVLHHGGIDEYCYTEETCSKQAREYQKLHMDVNHWDDIGYSFLVGEDGNVYEGRGWRRVGAHAPHYNDKSIGICIIGNFTGRLPIQKALDTVHQLIEQGVQEGLLMKNYTLVGHRQVRETLCPGDALYQEITTWPNWDSNPSPRKYCNVMMNCESGANKLTLSFSLAILFMLLFM